MPSADQGRHVPASPKRLSPVRARLILLGLAVLLAGAIVCSRSPTVSMTGSGGGGEDQALHLATIARLHAGDSYYVAVGDELRHRGYPSASVFNWRTPALFWALARSPVVSRVVFVVMGLIVLAATVRLLVGQPVPVVVAGAIAQSGALGVLFDPRVWVFHEVWAGYLLALSTLAYALRRFSTGALIGLLALCVRELAAPYAIICALLAWRAARWREMRIWIAGLCLYSLYYGWHFRQVVLHHQPNDVAHAETWLRFGGLPFILTTLGTNSLLHNRPAWLSAVAFVVLCAGLFARELPVHMRAAVIAYLVFFAIAGQPFNWYWGWLIAFVAPLVFAQALLVLPTLASTAAQKS